MNIPTSGEWPFFEVLLNPRQLKLNADFVYLRRGEKWPKTGGLLPARPVLVQSSASPSAHKNRHPPPPPPSYLAYCVYHSREKHYYYPGVVVEKELAENGTLAFYYGLHSVYDYTVCSANVVAVLNRKMPPQPSIDYSRRFGKL